jgi:hypothetical protein
MKRHNTFTNVSFILILGVLTSCSKGGLFGAGFLGGALTDLNVPGSFSSYQPPGNSKMTELKSNITGANNDVVKTIMVMAGVSTLADLQTALVDPTTGPTLRPIFSAYGLTIDNCPSDSGITVSDGTMSKTLEEAYIAPSDQIACSFSVTDFSTSIKNDLSKNNTVAAFTSAHEGGLLALPIYLNSVAPAFNCSDASVNFGDNGAYHLADYLAECNMLIQKVSVGGVPQPYTVYERILQRDATKASLKNTIIQQMASDDAAGDIKTFALSTIETSPTLKADLAKYVKKDAQEEFLQVALNSFMTHGVNMFSALTYLGFDSSSMFTGTGANTTALKGLYNKYQYNVIDTDIAKGDLFFAYKPGFRFFVDMFIDGRVDAYDSNNVLIADTNLDGLKSAKIFRYYINKENLCKYFSSTQADITNNVDITSGVASCLNTISGFIDRVSVIHNMTTRDVSFYYADNDTGSFLPQTKIMDALYTYNYNSDLRFDVDNIRKTAVSILKRELVENPSSSATNHLDQGDIDLLNKITTQGMISLRDQIQVGNQSDSAKKSLSDIGLSTFTSKLAISLGDLTDTSSDAGLYIKIPENLSGNAEVYDAYLAAGESIASSSEGDVIIDAKKSANALYVNHDRGNSIFKDRLGLNIGEINLNLPPYNLTEKDLLIAYLDLDEYCQPGQTIAPSGYAGCDAQFKLVKPNNVSGDPLAMTKMYFKQYALGHMGDANSIVTDWGFGLTPAAIKVHDTSVAINPSTKVGTRTITSNPEISPFGLYAHLNNSLGNGDVGVGSAALPLSTTTLPYGVYESSISSTDSFKVVVSNNGILSGDIVEDSNGNLPNIAFNHFSFDGVDANSNPLSINRCSVPFALSAATTNINGQLVSNMTSVATTILNNMLSTSIYAGTQYDCI